jgi:HSP20 family molecular chaperone IbpA
LEKITIPDSVTFMNATFEYLKGVTEITIPKSVKKMEGHPF